MAIGGTHPLSVLRRQLYRQHFCWINVCTCSKGLHESKTA